MPVIRKYFTYQQYQLTRDGYVLYSSGDKDVVVLTRSQSTSTPLVKLGDRYCHVQPTPYGWRRDYYPPNVYYIGDRNSSQPPSWYTVTGWADYMDLYGPVVGIPGPTFDELTQSALTSLDSEASSNMEMLTKDLIDSGKLATEYFERTLRAVPYLKRGQFAKAWKHFNMRKGKLQSSRKAISDHWLAYQWGVKPALDAIIEAYNQATDDDLKRSFRIIKRASSTTSFVDPIKSGVIQPANGTCFRSVWLYRYFTDVSYKDFKALWNNPVVPTWDAIPYSFLVDWFLPVGDYLRQFGWVGSFMNSRMIKGHNSYVEQVEIYPAVKRYVWLQSRDPCNWKSFNRKLDSSIHSTLSMSDVVERSEFGISAARLLNLAALVNQKLR